MAIYAVLLDCLNPLDNFRNISCVKASTAPRKLHLAEKIYLILNATI